ncbi:similar to Saccharomyces cerevisiae YBR008C FLR1 Plasma membrane multidrug transporter of the major facilitator superfamily [Maudiozyma barnettii]|uniref:Similar to Saccharomyces cerevisiae YBR008C FLR1 Plasma membrane multidrug transporter of the major facilitator superfamily n=1 Tax=Maudiozyma barnettii TaxID=61262 RepID=A0A8H2VG27_9SACH|nr:uncharacterized protein KABA2_05S05522 [Kazachstania barnettii]CAB4254974.1 similar to Saccharomyces cerevisiae YBR008C FLR1 Plasma membrane multidrug transporter of the major facilitator superfamily [Kazachstania barnettii]CAD1783245.1 similar to Saccharomyces cerevisiae YBR008C FLR1 Plasma membrane multidrug transporter of the major facilitator superfamily [Kazachstania barnettii]
MYTEYFKNTYMVDILEYLHIVTLTEEGIAGKTVDIENQLYPRLSASTQVCPEKHDDDALYNCENSINPDSDSIESSSISGTTEISINLNTTDLEETIIKEKELPDNDIATDPFLVTWNRSDDPDNPMNFDSFKKILIIVQIMMITFVTYMASAIITPGQEEIQNEFKVGHVTATLNLSIYVLAYGIGQAIFSPLSEVAKIGRQWIYTYTFFLFTVFQIGCATVHSFGGLVVLRFITGVLSGPALATGGASITDIIEGRQLTAYIALWAIGAVLAPVMAPIVGAAMVIAKGWRWIFWLLTMICAAFLVVFILFFPETSSNAILSRRASRIRKQTGDNRYYTIQEQKDSATKLSEFLITTFYRPFEMIIKEPIILAFDVYISVIYGALYLFFESIPIVFVGIYHFTLMESSVAFLGFFVGCVIAYPILILFLHKVIYPAHDNNTFVPEKFLLLAMGVAWLLPLSQFLFGWAASVHWIVPVISEIFFIIAVWNLFQVTFSYLAFSFPNHVASVFAGNGVMRSTFACAFPLFGKAMFNNLAIEGYPVGWGSTIVGFVTIGLSLIPFVLYKYGATLRSKSKFRD